MAKRRAKPVCAVKSKGCPVCLRRFKTPTRLEEHMKKTHPGFVPKTETKKIKFEFKKLDRKRFQKQISASLNEKEEKQSAGQIKNFKIEQNFSERACQASPSNPPSVKSDAVRYKYLFKCPVCVYKVFSDFVTSYRHIQENHCFDKNGVPCSIDSPNIVQPIKMIHCGICNAKVNKEEVHKCLMVNRQVLVSTYYCCTLCDACYIGLDMFIKHSRVVHKDFVQEDVFDNWCKLKDWKRDNHVEDDLQPYRVVGDLKFYMICRHEVPADGVTKRCPAFVSFYRVPETGQICIEYLFKHKGHCSAYSLLNKSEEAKKTEISQRSVEPKDKPAIMVQPVVPEITPRTHYEVRLVLKEVLEKTSNLDSDQLEIIYDAAVNFKRQVQFILDNGIGKSRKTNHLKTIDLGCKNLQAKDLQINSPKAINTSCKNLQVKDSQINSPKPTITSVVTVSTETPIATPELTIPKIVKTYSLRKNSVAKEDTDVSSEKRKVTDDSETSKTKRHFKPELSESPSFNDTFKSFLEQNFLSKDSELPTPKPCMVKRKGTNYMNTGVVTLPKLEIKPDLQTDMMIKEEVQEKISEKQHEVRPLSVAEFKNILRIDNYEVKERENDCNILILKI